MPRYNVTVSSQVEWTTNVFADDADEAEEIARERFSNIETGDLSVDHYPDAIAEPITPEDEE